VEKKMGNWVGEGKEKPRKIKRERERGPKDGRN